MLVPFVRPPYYAALLAPLAYLPFSTALWAWLGLQSAALVLCWAWAWKRFGPDALVLGFLYLPTAIDIAHGQDCVLMLGILILSYVVLERGLPFCAGLLLALGLAKFHLLVLFPLILAATVHCRLLAGFAAGGAILAVISALLGGRQGVAGYVALLRRNDLERLAPSPDQMINIHAIPATLHLPSLWLSALLVLAVVTLVLVAARRAPRWRWFSAAAAGSLLASPHVYGYDAGLLLLPLWLSVHQSGFRLTRVAATLLIVPLPFLASLAGPPWSLLPCLLLVLFLASLAGEPLRGRPRPLSCDHAHGAGSFSPIAKTC